MAPRIFVAVVRDGAMEGGFARIRGDVDLGGDVEALVARIKEEWSADLLDIAPRLITVYGPWDSAAEVPAVGDATSGCGLDIADPLRPLVVGKERAYFLVRITTPPAAGGVLL